MPEVAAFTIMKGTDAAKEVSLRTVIEIVAHLRGRHDLHSWAVICM